MTWDRIADVAIHNQLSPNSPSMILSQCRAKKDRSETGEYWVLPSMTGYYSMRHFVLYRDLIEHFRHMQNVTNRQGKASEDLNLLISD